MKMIDRHEHADGSVVAAFEEPNGTTTIAHSAPDPDRIKEPIKSITLQDLGPRRKEQPSE